MDNVRCGLTVAIAGMTLLWAGTGHAAEIVVGTAVGPPGGQASFSVTLNTMGAEVATLGNVISFDSLTPIIACEVNPAINKDETEFRFSPSGCTPGVDCTSIRLLVLSFSNLDPIPDGSVLYSCTVEIDVGAGAGSYPLICSDSDAFSSTPLGNPVPTTCADGVVQVTNLDHFKCYKTKDLKQPKFVKTTVNLADQFGVNDGRFELKKPFLVCNPVDKNGEGIINIDDHLTCYKMKESREVGGADKRFVRPTVVVENQLGSSTLQPKKAFLLCVPTDSYMCGDGAVDPGEECDGSDDGACPGRCGWDCECQPLTCPVNGDDNPTACAATESIEACRECCDNVIESLCVIACGDARDLSCTDHSSNGLCAIVVNAGGCADVCCP